MAASDRAPCALGPGRGASERSWAGPAAAHLLSAGPGGHPSGRPCVGTGPPGKKWAKTWAAGWREASGRERTRLLGNKARFGGAAGTPVAPRPARRDPSRYARLGPGPESAVAGPPPRTVRAVARGVPASSDLVPGASSSPPSALLSALSAAPAPPPQTLMGRWPRQPKPGPGLGSRRGFSVLFSLGGS